MCDGEARQRQRGRAARFARAASGLPVERARCDGCAAWSSVAEAAERRAMRRVAGTRWLWSGRADLIDWGGCRTATSNRPSAQRSAISEERSAADGESPAWTRPVADSARHAAARRVCLCRARAGLVSAVTHHPCALAVAPARTAGSSAIAAPSGLDRVHRSRVAGCGGVVSPQPSPLRSKSCGSSASCVGSE